MSPTLKRASLAWLATAIGCAMTTTASAADPTAGGEACESAVAETIRDMRGNGAHELQVGAARPVVPQPAGDHATLAGKGQYRGSSGPSRPFTYTCSFDAQTGKATGVVFKESGGASAEVEKPWEPDLSRLSPEACEAAAAAALTEQYPPIGRIRFQSDSRRLRAAPAARTSLEGQGSLERVAGMNAAPFTYRCLFEAASGKIVSVQTED